jgi:hypothetical protein
VGPANEPAPTRDVGSTAGRDVGSTAGRDVGPTAGRDVGPTAGRVGRGARNALPAEAPAPRRPGPGAEVVAPRRSAAMAPGASTGLHASTAVGGSASTPGDDEDPDREPVSMTLDELATASGLSSADVTELERFGLLAGRRVAGTTYYDGDALEVACVAAGFRSFGVEARHLRMYRTAVEREAGFFEQVVTPMLKQRNPQARRQAVATLLELSRLGQAMRSAAMRQALREYTGGA